MTADDSGDPPTCGDFQRHLDAILDKAKRDGLSSITVQAGDLHRMAGGYPNKGNHRIPLCCSVMRDRMRKDDRILTSPPNGDGASLLVLYLLEG